MDKLYNIEQSNLLSYVKTLVGLTPTYTRLVYFGAIAGSEFLTYNAKKLYICWECRTTYNTAVSGSFEQLLLYNQANAIMFYLNATITGYTGAALVYLTNTAIFKNFWFSRVAVSNINWINFNGIRVTWP